MRKYRNSTDQGNYPIKEENHLPSMTVPDQAMSIEEILVRFASGTLPDVMHNIEYSDDMPDLRGLDISELMDMKKQAQEDTTYLENELQTRSKELKKQRFAKSEPPTPPTPLTPPNTP
ncbi:hypothetical protein [Jeotgalibaca porci]|uniref:hypothetical protein n=1 Tax=Jeotgalibaca porci TaxID=1868793 RepID=UPI00359FF3C5